MIRTFRDKETEKVFKQLYSGKFPRSIQKRALVKLILLDAAKNESDLKSPPGNRFKQLGGKRKGEYSLRINDQWQLCFKFENGDAFDVRIEDYH